MCEKGSTANEVRERKLDPRRSTKSGEMNLRLQAATRPPLQALITSSKTRALRVGVPFGTVPADHYPSVERTLISVFVRLLQGSLQDLRSLMCEGLSSILVSENQI